MKITAVVVTYNRLELLKKSIECLHAALKQVQSENIDCHICVINNGSTDGTHEWLDEQAGLEVIHQDNVGGSGGFYTGIKKAYEEGADWIWCMDDDVFPKQHCLLSLLEEVNKHKDEPLGILSPRRLLEGVIFTHEFQHFNFTNPLASMHGKKIKGHDLNETIEIVGCDFEGPFISRKVVETIGFPNKDLFIFCDDTEYCLCTHLAGFKLYYVPSALMDKHKFFSNDSWTTKNQKKKWKRYYQVRNEAYMNHHYGKNWSVRYLRSFIGLIGYYIPALFSMPFSKAWKLKDLKVLWEAYQDGIHEKLGIKKFN